MDQPKTTPSETQVACQHQEDVQHDKTVIPTDLDDPHRAALEENPTRAETPSLATIVAVLFLALSFICPISCGFTLVTGVIYKIQMDLGDTENKITWLVGGWSLASAVSFALAGCLSDVFGRRWTIMVGQTICIVGSIVAAKSKTVEVIIVGSTCLGFGCGIIFVAYAGISELLPNKWRGIGLAATEWAISVPWGIANVLLANHLATNTALGWRWCYYIGLIFGVVSLLGTFAFYFPPPRPQYDQEKSRWHQVKQVDYVGFMLFVGGLTSMLIGLTWAGQPQHPWKGASVIAPIVVGFVSLLACFIYDFTVPTMPLFPWRVIREVRDFTILLVIVFVAGVVYYALMGLIPQGSLFLFTSDDTEIGLIALPNGFSQWLFAAVASALIGVVKHVKLQIIFALVTQTVFTAALAGATSNKAAWMALQAFSLGPFAYIALLCYVTTGLNVPLRHLGLASGLIGTFRSVGGSIGNAIFNTILQGSIRDNLGPKIAAAAIQNGFDPTQLDSLIPATINAVLGVPGSFAEVPGVTRNVEVAAIKALRQVYARGFQLVFYSTIPFGVIAIVLALFLRDPSQYLTNHTAVKMTKEGLPNHKARSWANGNSDKSNA